nr:unnamed protein product [Trypanosoma congolense IL3000]
MYDAPTQPPIAVVLAGSPVVTQFQCLDGVRWVTPLGPAPESIVVFLTAPTPLQPGNALGIYLAREDDGAFAYVGHVSNTLPSAILRVPSSFISIDTPVRVVLGISAEREDDMKNMGDAALQQLEEERVATKLALSERLVEELYNFVSSYGRLVPTDPNNSQSEEAIFLPTSFVDLWRRRVLAKLRKDSTFWK